MPKRMLTSSTYQIGEQLLDDIKQHRLVMMEAKQSYKVHVLCRFVNTDTGKRLNLRVLNSYDNRDQSFPYENSYLTNIGRITRAHKAYSSFEFTCDSVTITSTDGRSATITAEPQTSEGE